MMARVVRQLAEGLRVTAVSRHSRVVCCSLRRQDVGVVDWWGCAGSRRNACLEVGARSSTTRASASSDRSTRQEQRKRYDRGKPGGKRRRNDDNSGPLLNREFLVGTNKKGPVIMTKRPDAKLPFLDALIVVEGFRDLQAVTQAVNATVLVCNGSRILNKGIRDDVKMSLKRFKEKIVLMDPDGEGRRMRTKIDEFVGPCHHAFIPEPLAVNKDRKKPRPDGIDIGVEHASPEAVAEALLNPKLSTRGRDDITWDDLEDLRLVQSCGSRGDDVRARRTFFCGELGIGFCDGSVLVKQVNRFGFSWSDVTKANKKGEERLKEWQKEREAAAEYEATKHDFEESSDDEPI
ncbi:hypothetical protein BSKO_00628 [Bryopsis sp. KO-2023]|nr:hypothetical protein BSKO_00628 [Bryopsis sp. KO-2023]